MMKLYASITATLASVVIVLALLVATANDTVSQETVQTPWKPLSGTEKIFFADTVSFKKLTWIESLNWAMDFVRAPKRANDRLVLHVYDTSIIDDEFNAALTKVLTDESLFFAIAISSTELGKTFNKMSGVPIHVTKLSGFTYLPIVSEVVAQIGTQKAETAFLLVSEEVPGFKPQKSRLVGSKKDWPPGSPEFEYSP